MNRIIKFRAWDNISKKMFYPESLNAFHIYHDGTWDLLEDNSAIHPDEVEYLTKDTSDGEMSKWWDGVLMQYTGLTDKNGKDIYEGDIFIEGGAYSKVTYKNGSFKASYIKGKTIRVAKNVGFGTWAKRVEVVGNIYQDPNLLS